MDGLNGVTSLETDQPETGTPVNYEKLLEEANERFKDVSDRDKENRENAVEDTKFVYCAGEQWPSEVRGKRAKDDPMLEFPQLKQFIHQVVNDNRQSRPGIRTHPAGGKSSEEVSDILQGMIRHIEYDSDAEAAYDEGLKGAVLGGRGWWRILTEYENPTSFNQKIVIKPIRDPSTVRADIDYQEPDGSDRRFAFVTERVPKDEFARRWPDAKELSWDPTGNNSSWYDGDKAVYVADYYRIVERERELVMMSDGAVGWADEMPPPPPNVTEKARRAASDRSLEWYTLAGGEQVLKKHEIRGKYIPVVCCVGDEIFVDGKRVFQGLIRGARDTQMMFNMGMTQQALALALAPRAPWVAAEGQLEGYEDVWKQANKKNYSVLPYKPTTFENHLVPAPQRTQPAPPASGWIEWCQQMSGMFKSTIGMYENSLGMRGQEVSGRAITAREKQGDNATFHFTDNMARAISLTGKIVVDMIPSYYDTERIVTIVGVDDSRSNPTVNQQVQQVDPATGAVQVITDPKTDLTTGEYAVTVETGPSYATKRQEMNETMLSLVQSFPQMLQFAGDLIIGTMDFADSDELSERFKLMLPPQIQQALQAEEAGQNPEVAQLQQQLQQVQQQAQQALQGMQGQLQQAEAQLASKQGDNEMKMQVEQIKAQTMQLKAEADQTKAVLDLLKTMLTLQQQQTMPIGPEAMQMAPQANAAAQQIEG